MHTARLELVPATPEELEAARAGKVELSGEGSEWGTRLFLSDGVAVGSGGFLGEPNEDGHLTLDFRIAEEERGKGYATEAVVGLLAAAFGSGRVRRVVAFGEDPACARVLEKTGFAGEGGRWERDGADFVYAAAAQTALGWPGVEESLSYGTPALKAKGALMSRLREDGVLVVKCDFEERDLLVVGNPAVYYVSDHYVKSRYVLVRLDEALVGQVVDRLRRAYEIVNPKQA